MHTQRILFLLFIVGLSFTACKKQSTVNLSDTRSQLLYYMENGAPSLNRLSPEHQKEVIKILLEELHKYEKTDAVLTPLELSTNLFCLSTILTKNVGLFDLRVDFETEILGPFLYDIGKHNHLKNHTNLRNFPINAESYILWLVIHYYRAESFDRLRFSADSLLQVIDEQQLLSAEELDNIGKRIFKDLNYFQDQPELSPKEIKEVKNESLRIYLVLLMNNYYHKLENIYNEAETLALNPLTIPYIPEDSPQALTSDQEETSIEQGERTLQLLFEEMEQLYLQNQLNDDDLAFISEQFDKMATLFFTWEEGDTEQSESISGVFSALKAKKYPASLYENIALFCQAVAHETGVNIEEALFILLE